jgi:hypothetical protein
MSREDFLQWKASLTHLASYRFATSVDCFLSTLLAKPSFDL